MGNACIEVCDYYEWATVLTDKTRRAAKSHTCGECGETIQKGVLYLYETALFEGTVTTHKTCARCWQIRKDYFHSWTWGRMVECFYDAHGFDYRDGIPADFAPCEKGGE